MMEQCPTLEWIRRGILLGKRLTKIPNEKESYDLVNWVIVSHSIEPAHGVDGIVPS